jgi:hypothetical protein
MKYHGYYWSSGYKDPDGRVTEAVLTKTKLSLDYEEDGHKGHLEARPTDRDFFQGEYSYSSGWRGVGQSSFRLFRSGERVLLFGTWNWPPTGDEGTWVIVLDPLEEKKSQTEQQQ